MCSLRLLAAYVDSADIASSSCLQVQRKAASGDSIPSHSTVRLGMPQQTHSHVELRQHQASFDGDIRVNSDGYESLQHEIAGAVSAVASGLEDHASVVLLGASSSGKSAWLLGKKRTSLLHSSIRGILEQFGEVSVRAAGLVGKRILDFSVSQDACQARIRSDVARERLSKDGKVNIKRVVRIVDLPSDATEKELDASRSKRLTSIPTGSGSNHVSTAGVRTEITGLQRVKIYREEQIELWVSFLRRNLRSLQLDARQVGPLGRGGTPGGIHLSIFIDVPGGGCIRILKVSGASQLQEHDNRAGFSEAATRASAVARRKRAGLTNRANLAISNVLGWLALDSLRSSGLAGAHGTIASPKAGSARSPAWGGSRVAAPEIVRRRISALRASPRRRPDDHSRTDSGKVTISANRAEQRSDSARAAGSASSEARSIEPGDLSMSEAAGPLVPFRDHPVTRLLRQALLEDGQTLIVTFLKSDPACMEDTSVHLANARKLRVV